MHLLVDRVRLDPCWTQALPPDPGRWRAADGVQEGAIWIADGVIAAVGPRDPVRAQAGPEVAVVDGAGAFAIPGFVDSHLHLVRWALARTRLDVGGCACVGEVLEVLKAAASRMPPGRWLVAHGLDPEALDPWPSPPPRCWSPSTPAVPLPSMAGTCAACW